MSKDQFRQALLSEIDRINEKIDQKIVRGRPYRKEAQRHKLLLAKLSYLTSEQQKLPFSSRLFSLFL